MGLEEPFLAILFTSAFVFVALSVTYTSVYMITSAAGSPVVWAVVDGNVSGFTVTLVEASGPPIHLEKIIFSTNAGLVTCIYNASWVCDGPLRLEGGAELLPGSVARIDAAPGPGLFTAGRRYPLVVVADSHDAFFTPRG